MPHDNQNTGLFKVPTGSIGPNGQIFDVFLGTGPTAEHIKDPNDPRLRDINIPDLPIGQAPAGFQSQFKPIASIQPSESPEDLAKRLSGGITATSPVGTSDAERAKIRQAEIDRIKTELKTGTQTPSLFKSVDEFNRLRTEKGIVVDEEELASIRNEALLGKEELRKFSATAGQGVTEAGRIGAVSEAERSLNFRLEGLAIREQGVLSRLNTKNAYINTAIQLGQQDFNNARQEYEFAYNQNLKAVQLYNQQLDDEQKDALTGFTTIANLLKDKNLASIDPSLSSQLDSLALRAGLPTGLFQSIISALPDEKILAPIQVETATGKDVYFFTQNEQSGEPSLKKVQHLAGSGKGPEAETTRLSPLAQSVINGIVSLDDLTPTQRGVVATELNAAGFTKAPGQFASAKALLDQVEELSKTVNTASGIGRFLAGTKAKIGSILQTNQDAALFEAQKAKISLLVRALGEKGVLTDKDVIRVASGLPGLFDSREIARRKIQSLREFIANVELRSTREFISPQKQSLENIFQ